VLNCPYGDNDLRRLRGHVHHGDVCPGRPGNVFVLLFALGCLLSSVYGFLSGAWPFGVIELIWCGVAINRDRQLVPPQPA